jgi:UDP-glucuronate 4-epimerase
VKVNIEGLVTVLEAVKKHEVRSFVFASSSSVYGNNKKLPFSEDDAVDRPISPYAATKKAGELICHTYHHLFNINIACLRFFTVYGPRQRPDLAIHKFTKMILNGSPISIYGDGGSRRDYTYIDDIIDGVEKALNWVCSEQSRYDIFNLGESNTVTLREMVAAIERATHRQAVINSLPMQPGDVDCTYADIAKAKEVLGYHPQTPFETGIGLFVDWFLKNGQT